MKKILKYLLYIVSVFVLLIGGIAFFIAAQPETAIVKTTGNGVTFEVYGRKHAKSISVSTMPDGSEVILDGDEIIYRDGKLFLNGEEEDVAGAKKIIVRLRSDGIDIEQEK